VNSNELVTLEASLAVPIRPSQCCIYCAAYSQRADCLPQRVDGLEAEVWGSTHGLGPAGPLLRPPVLEMVVHVTPKTQNDRSIGRSRGPAKGAARSPRHMESQLAWSGGDGTTFATAWFCRFTEQLHTKLAPAAQLQIWSAILRRAGRR
jgi:hypothetical protein